MVEEIKSLEGLEAAVTEGDAAVVTEELVNREPVRDKLGRSYATGKRKDAVARVWIKPGPAISVSADVSTTISPGVWARSIGSLPSSIPPACAVKRCIKTKLPACAPEGVKENF